MCWNSTLCPAVPRFDKLKLNLALDVANLPRVGKPQQNQELSHWSHRQKCNVHRPLFRSSLSSENLGSPGLEEEDCDTNVLKRLMIKNFSFPRIPILTLNRRRMTAWRGNPIFISNIIVDTSDTRPNTCMIISIEKKSPIRDFLLMQKNILSMILCWSPISLMEP